MRLLSGPPFRAEHIGSVLVRDLDEVGIDVVRRRWIRVAVPASDRTDGDSRCERLRGREVAQIVEPSGHPFLIGSEAIPLRDGVRMEMLEAVVREDRQLIRDGISGAKFGAKGLGSSSQVRQEWL